MQSKDIILQVADETAEVMEEISEQLFDETDARFDEVIKHLEKLCSDFTGYAGKSDQQTQANQTEVLQKFEPVLEALSKLDADGSGQAVELKAKSDSIIAVLNEISQLLQGLSEDVLSTSGKCNSISEQLREFVSASQAGSEKLLVTEESNAEFLKKLSVQNDVSVKELSGKLGEITVCLEALSSSMTAIAKQQNDLYQKQSDLVKDVQYLKLPFYKREK